MNIKESTLNLITRRVQVAFEKTFQQPVSFTNKISGHFFKVTWAEELNTGSLNCFL